MIPCGWPDYPSICLIWYQHISVYIIYQYTSAKSLLSTLRYLYLALARSQLLPSSTRTLPHHINNMNNKIPLYPRHTWRSSSSSTSSAVTSSPSNNSPTKITQPTTTVMSNHSIIRITRVTNLLRPATGQGWQDFVGVEWSTEARRSMYVQDPHPNQTTQLTTA